jgi:tetratricopeptide (TPR) repeat protein
MARKRRPTAWDHNALGAHFFRIGAYDLAAAEFREATRLLPFSPISYFNLACAYHARHRDEEAIAALRQTLVLDAAHMKAGLLLAELLAARGETDAARVELEAVLASSSEGPETAEARKELRKLKSPRG